MTRLRQMMLDELQRRNYSPSTMRSYIRTVEDFAQYFGRSPYRLGPKHIRQYQAHLFRDRKLSAGTIQIKTAALRFPYVKTLRRPYLHEQIPFPKRPRPLPTVLSPEEVERLIASAKNLMHRTMLMTLYATGCTTTQATGVPMYERHDAPQVDKIPLENGRAPAKWNCDDYGEGWSALVFGLSHTCPQSREK